MLCPIAVDRDLHIRKINYELCVIYISKFPVKWKRCAIERIYKVCSYVGLTETFSKCHASICLNISFYLVVGDQI